MKCVTLCRSPASPSSPRQASNEPLRLNKVRTSVHELPDGYEIAFPSDAETYRQAAEYVDGERVCCPFFEINVRVTAEGGPLWLRFTGRPGTKQFIEADVTSWISPVTSRK